jgi:hypothetical protein
VKNRSSLYQGILGGLKLTIIFLVAFKLVGYRLKVSFIFGAIAGITGGVVINWWHRPEDFSAPVTKIMPKKPSWQRNKRYRSLSLALSKQSQKHRQNKSR